MKSKQTLKESVRNHDQVGRAMWRCALITVLVILSQDFSVKAIHEFSKNETASPNVEEDQMPEIVQKDDVTSTDSSIASSLGSHSVFNGDSSENSKHCFTSETAEGGVRNVHIYPLYSSTGNKIVLNISWDEPLDDIGVNSYDFKITPTSTEAACSGRLYDIIKKNKTLTHILLPPPLSPYEIKALCAYKISIIKVLPDLRKATTNLMCTLPECVGPKCSCKHLTPALRDLKVVEIVPGKLNISWGINYDQARETANNITNISLEYRAFSLKNRYPFLDLIRLSNLTFGKNYYILTDSHKSFIPNNEYQLEASFYNTFKCRATNYTNFKVSAVEVHGQPTHANEVVKPDNSSWGIIFVIIVLSIVMLFVIYLLRRNRLVLKELVLNPCSLRFTRRGRDRRESRNSYVVVPTITKRQQETNLLYVEKEILDGNVDRYELPRSRITMIREIGEGAFGKVFLAKAFDIRNQPGYAFVAVKTLRERAPPEEMDDFLSEIEILKKVGEHPNIVSMFGCCILKEPYLMVMEFVPCGDLKHYLLDLRQKWLMKKRSRNDSTPVFSDSSSDCTYITPDSPRSQLTSDGRPSVTETEYTILDSEGFPTPTGSYNGKVDCNLDHTELQSFALQIAKGMEHLERIPIAHRDLAARNILIDEYKTLKISDFGLSRIGPYVNSKAKRLPLRWLAIEAIEDNFYDSKSDVWSFAVVLWEIGTLGAFPYENIVDGMLRHHLVSGKRLPRPEICTDDLYSLMLRCWSHEPTLRPSFQELVELLDVKKRRIYVDFNQLNPLYVFPPSTLPENDKKLSVEPA